MADVEQRIPDWQLPRGVDRALWEYLQSQSMAEDYDEEIADTHLLQMDHFFLDEFFQRPGRLVDLGCGTGRLVLHFAERGFDVTGVDLSPPMLAVCRRKCDERRQRVELVAANLCELATLADQSFDYAICMFSTLGMIVGLAERRRALAEIRRVLKPGGLFGFHLHNRWFNAFDPQGRVWLARDILKRLVGRPDAGDKVQPRYRGIPNLRLHVYTAVEIRRELMAAGFDRLEQRPLAPDRRGRLSYPWFFPGVRCNGWLCMARRSN